MAASDDELRFYREQRDRALSRFASSPENVPAAVIVKRAIEFYHQVITPPADADYRTPEHFSRTVHPKARRELADLLAALRDFRIHLVGLTLGDAQVLYNGDEYALLLWHDFDDWVTAHVRSRLAKPSHRDLGNPFFRFSRLQDEFGSWFERLVLAPNSGHMVPLARLHKKVSWDLYRGTWCGAVTRDERGLVSGVNAGDPLVSHMLDAILERNHWHREGLIKALAASNPGLSAVGEDHVVAAELRGLVHDLVEMRGLLSRTFTPSDHVLELAPSVFVAWNWEIGHLAGTVEMSTSAENVARSVEAGTSGYAVSLDMDGLPREMTTPWLDLGPDVAAWVLGVVRPIHAHLLALWYAAERPTPTSPSGDDSGDGEAVAAACEAMALADPDAEPPAAADDRAPRLRVPAVRAVTLLVMLDRVFGCEVKRGKGSEITVWRPGGKKFTLPGHERNTHFHSHTVRALLRAVGIGAAEFCAAAGR